MVIETKWSHNHIISECSKLAQKGYKTRHDWWERWSTKNCAKNGNRTILPDGIRTNQNLSRRMRHTKLLWDFEIKTDHLILTRRLDRVMANKEEKENRPNRRLCNPGWPQSENQKKVKERKKVLRPCQRTKKVMGHESDGYTINNVCAQKGLRGLLGWLEEFEIGERTESLKTAVLVKFVTILRRFLETWEDLLSLEHQWKTIT